MVSWQALKRKVKLDLQGIVNQVGSVDKSKFIAEVCLNTGFNDRTVIKLLEDMAEVGYIEIDGNVIRKPKGKEQTEVIQ